MRMIRTGQAGGRGAGIIRDLAPIAAAAGAAALTVTLVVGPTTARLRSVSGTASEAALVVDDAGRRGVSGGDVTVRVRPQRPSARAALTDVFDLVSGPATSAVAASTSTSTFVVSARPQPASPVRIGTPGVLTALPVAPAADVPAPTVLSGVISPPVAPPTPTPTPTVVAADAPTKRPVKPLRPVKVHEVPASTHANIRAFENAAARADQTADKADAPSDEKKADKSKK